MSADFNVQTALIEMEHRLQGSIDLIRAENKADHSAVILRLDEGGKIFNSHDKRLDRLERTGKARARRMTAIMGLAFALAGESLREHWSQLWSFLHS